MPDRNRAYLSEVSINGKQVIVSVDEDDRGYPSSVEIIASSEEEPRLALGAASPFRTNPALRSRLGESVIQVMLNWRGFRSETVSGPVVGNPYIGQATSPQAYAADFVLAEYYGLTAIKDGDELDDTRAIEEEAVRQLGLRPFNLGEVNIEELRGYQNLLFGKSHFS